MELPLALSILCGVMTVSNFVLSIKNNSVKDARNTSYNQGKLEEKIQHILDEIKELKKHIEVYDKEIDNKIEIALQHHIAIYHKENK